MTRRGRLFGIAAPSGSGKTSLLRALMDKRPSVEFSVSCTTRAPRAHEQDGRDYHFISRTEFEAMVSRGEFLEWADVFGNLYGTRAPDTDRLLAAGQDVVLVIDVQGARQVRRTGLPTTSVFVLPPSYEVLEQRLRRRSKDPEAAISSKASI